MINEKLLKTDYSFYAKNIRIDMFNANILLLCFEPENADILLTDPLFENNRMSFDADSIFSENYIMEELSQMLYESLTESECSGTMVYNGRDMIIYINESFKNDHLPVLVHEITHTVDQIFKFLELGENTEVRAYMTEYIFKNLYSDMLKYENSLNTFNMKKELKKKSMPNVKKEIK